MKMRICQRRSIRLFIIITCLHIQTCRTGEQAASESGETFSAVTYCNDNYEPFKDEESSGENRAMPTDNDDPKVKLANFRDTRSRNSRQKYGCDQNTILSDENPEVLFSLTDYVYLKNTTNCSWKIKGLSNCKVVLNCDVSFFDRKDCKREKLLITDGYRGYIQLCDHVKDADLFLENLTSTGELRDIFIQYSRHILARPRKVNGTKLFTCLAHCKEPNQTTRTLPLVEDQQKIAKCYCGTRPLSQRIVGGVETSTAELPWLVALVFKNTRQMLCAGSVINSQYVLTARHCFVGNWLDRTQFQILVNSNILDPSCRVRSWDELNVKFYSRKLLNKLDRGNGTRRYNVSEIFVPAQNVFANNDFDVALIKLDNPIDLLFSSPVCLPLVGNYAKAYDHIPAVVAGWGLTVFSPDAMGTAKPHKAKVLVMPDDECHGYHWNSTFTKFVKTRMMCAGYRKGGIDSCVGDSGGPLMVQNQASKVWTVVGITSWGESCAEPDKPGVYFRVPEVVQWINYVIKYEYNEYEDKGVTWCERI